MEPTVSRLPCDAVREFQHDGVRWRALEGWRSRAGHTLCYFVVLQEEKPSAADSLDRRASLAPGQSLVGQSEEQLVELLGSAAPLTATERRDRAAGPSPGRSQRGRADRASCGHATGSGRPRRSGEGLDRRTGSGSAGRLGSVGGQDIRHRKCQLPPADIEQRRQRIAINRVSGHPDSRRVSPGSGAIQRSDDASRDDPCLRERCLGQRHHEGPVHVAPGQVGLSQRPAEGGRGGAEPFRPPHPELDQNDREGTLVAPAALQLPAGDGVEAFTTEQARLLIPERREARPASVPAVATCLLCPVRGRPRVLGIRWGGGLARWRCLDTVGARRSRLVSAALAEARVVQPSVALIRGQGSAVGCFVEEDAESLQLVSGAIQESAEPLERFGGRPVAKPVPLQTHQAQEAVKNAVGFSQPAQSGLRVDREFAGFQSPRPGPA